MTEAGWAEYRFCPRCGRVLLPGPRCIGCDWVPHAPIAPVPPVADRPQADLGPPAPLPREPSTTPPRPATRPVHNAAPYWRNSRTLHRGPTRPRSVDRSPGDPASTPPSPPAAVPPAPPPLPPVPAPIARPASSPATPVPPVAAVPPPRASPPSSSSRRRPFRPIDLWKRYLPPVRLVWLFLGVLLASVGGFESAAIAGPLVTVPIVGAIVDLAFQRVRFPRLRFPDAALATSLFVSLIVWPATVDLALLSVAIVSVGLRHVLRVNSHPVLNPAAAGIAVATVLFGLSTSWHLGFGTTAAALVVALGAVLIVRAPHTWRMPVFYFAAYLPVTIAIAVGLGAGGQLVPLLEAGALGPASLFFGLFMVSEPRTAPTARRAMAIFAGLVGLVAGVLPLLFAEVAALGPLGVLAPFLALFAGNVVTAVLPSARGSGGASRRPAERSVRRPGVEPARES